jgi:hypothetical protein
MSNNDIRPALERLVELNDGFYEETPGWIREQSAALAAARAALAAEPVGEGPSELELEAIELALWDRHRIKGWGGEEFMYDNNFSRAMEEYRAILTYCGRPAAPPKTPDPGEVGELVKWLRSRAGIPGSPDFPAVAAHLTRAATLLQQLSTPAPVPVAECPHCGYGGEMARVPHAGEVEA